jgi:hypothetical protein
MVDAASVMVWGGVVSFSFCEVFYRIGTSECYSYVGVTYLCEYSQVCYNAQFNE